MHLLWRQGSFGGTNGFLITDISKKELQWAAKKGLFVFPVP